MNLHAQIHTITIDDLADTSKYIRLAGLTEAGALVDIPLICVDSGNCLVFLDTFGLKRMKIVLDSNIINVFIFKGGKKVFVKKINIFKKTINVCGLKVFKWKYKDAECIKRFTDSTVIKVYRDTFTGDSIVVERNPTGCYTTTRTSKSDAAITEFYFDDGSIGRIIHDSDGNFVGEIANPDSCSVTEVSSWSTATCEKRFSEGQVSVTYEDSSGKSMTQTHDLENCEIRRSMSDVPLETFERIDSPGVSVRGVRDTSGAAILEVWDPRTQSVCYTGKDPSPSGSDDCINTTIKGNVEITKDLVVQGIIAGTKDFRIDHPLDPENRYLHHSCIEGPERINLYNGTVVTDEDGFYTIQMPEYFMALNKDFEYNLTILGRTFAQAVVWDEMDEHGTFRIRTNEPNVKVSWQVTGIRHDKIAKENPFVVERWKEDASR